MQAGENVTVLLTREGGKRKRQKKARGGAMFRDRPAWLERSPEVSYGGGRDQLEG